jgi:hypothetical protein
MRFLNMYCANVFSQVLKQNGLEHYERLDHEKINLGAFGGQKSYETTGSGMLGLAIIPYNEHSYVEYQEIFTNDCALKLKGNK